MSQSQSQSQPWSQSQSRSQGRIGRGKDAGLALYTGEYDMNHDHIAGRGGQYSVARIPLEIPRQPEPQYEYEVTSESEFEFEDDFRQIQVVELCFHNDFRPQPSAALSLHFSRRYQHGVAVWPVAPRIPRLSPPNSLVELGIIRLHSLDDHDAARPESGQSAERQRSHLVSLALWSLGLYALVATVFSIYSHLYNTSPKVDRPTLPVCATDLVSHTSLSLSLPYDIQDMLQRWATVPVHLLSLEMCDNKDGATMHNSGGNVQREYAPSIACLLPSGIGQERLAQLTIPMLAITINHHIHKSRVYALRSMGDAIQQIARVVRGVVRINEQPHMQTIWHDALRDIEDLGLFPEEVEGHTQPRLPSLETVSTVFSAAQHHLSEASMMWPDIWTYAEDIADYASRHALGLIASLESIPGSVPGNLSLEPSEDDQFIDRCFMSPASVCLYCNDIATSPRLPLRTTSALTAFLRNTGGMEAEEDNTDALVSIYGSFEVSFLSGICSPVERGEGVAAQQQPHASCSLLHKDDTHSGSTPSSSDLVASHEQWASVWLDEHIQRHDPTLTKASYRGYDLAAVEPELIALARDLATAAVLVDRILEITSLIPPGWVAADALVGLDMEYGDLSAIRHQSRSSWWGRWPVNSKQRRAMFVKEAVSNFTEQSKALKHLRTTILADQEAAVITSLASLLEVNRQWQQMRNITRRLLVDANDADVWFQEDSSGASSTQTKRRKRLPRPEVMVQMLRPISDELEKSGSKVRRWVGTVKAASYTESWYHQTLRKQEDGWDRQWGDSGG